jgi:hypothetical protein
MFCTAFALALSINSPNHHVQALRAELTVKAVQDELARRKEELRQAQIESERNREEIRKLQEQLRQKKPDPKRP